MFIVFAWIAKRLIFALPMLMFRRSFVGGLISLFLLRKLSKGAPRR
jgi:hypothetical protein